MRIVSVLLVLLWPLSALAQGFAGLGAESEGYAEVRPDPEITFPADHGPHPDYRIEWWYITANLMGEDGRDYGVQWTLFRQTGAPPPQREGWESQQLWMGHAALTTPDAHYHAERLGRGGIGQAGAQATPFVAWIDDWAFESTGADFSPLSMRAEGEDFAFALQLATDAPMVKQGEGGYSVKSDRGQASYYVSQPFFEVSGEITVEGRVIVVSGRGWMDREWSTQPLAPEQEGWDWFSLHLGTGEKLMLFRLREGDGGAYFSGNWIMPDGQSTPIRGDDIAMEPLRSVHVAGRSVPVDWRLSIPARGLDVTVQAINAQAWNGTLFPYWEGPIRISGTHDGIGYLEMTGYEVDE